MYELTMIEDVRKSRMLMVFGELSLLSGDVAVLYGIDPRKSKYGIAPAPQRWLARTGQDPHLGRTGIAYIIGENLSTTRPKQQSN